MKKRLMEKMERARRRDIHRLLDLVLDINGLYPRRQELTGNAPTAFLYLSGHIASIQVTVTRDGWREDAGDDICVSAHTYEPGRISDAVRELRDYALDGGIIG